MNHVFHTRRDVERYASDQPISKDEQQAFVNWILRQRGNQRWGVWCSEDLPEIELCEILESEMGGK